MSQNLARRFFLFPVKLYQKYISPFLGKNCIYEPSCSNYTIEAVEKHGIIKGFFLAAARILRCNKHFMGGQDPVPQDFSWKSVKNPWIVFRRKLNNR